MPGVNPESVDYVTEKAPAFAIGDSLCAVRAGNVTPHGARDDATQNNLLRDAIQLQPSVSIVGVDCPSGCRQPGCMAAS